MSEAARAWVGSAATWTTGGAFNWRTAGASNTTTGSIDRGGTSLWSSTGSFGGSPGGKTVTLNPTGVTVVQRWAAGGLNNGVIIQDYTNGSSDNLIFESSESTRKRTDPTQHHPLFTQQHCA